MHPFHAICTHFIIAISHPPTVKQYITTDRNTERVPSSVPPNSVGPKHRESEQPPAWDNVEPCAKTQQHWGIVLCYNGVFVPSASQISCSFRLSPISEIDPNEPSLPGQTWGQCFKVQISPISIQKCVAKCGCCPTVVSKKGGVPTDRQTHKGTLQLYIVDFF